MVVDAVRRRAPTSFQHRQFQSSDHADRTSPLSYSQHRRGHPGEKCSPHPSGRSLRAIEQRRNDRSRSCGWIPVLGDLQASPGRVPSADSADWAHRGVALARLAAARRTQSSYSAFLGDTTPPYLHVNSSSQTPGQVRSSGMTRRSSTRSVLPHVRVSRSIAEPILPLTRRNVQHVPCRRRAAWRIYFDMDRLTITQAAWRIDPCRRGRHVSDVVGPHWGCSGTGVPWASRPRGQTEPGLFEPNQGPATCASTSGGRCGPFNDAWSRRHRGRRTRSSLIFTPCRSGDSSRQLRTQNSSVHCSIRRAVAMWRP